MRQLQQRNPSRGHLFPPRKSGLGYDWFIETEICDEAPAWERDKPVFYLLHLYSTRVIRNSYCSINVNDRPHNVRYSALQDAQIYQVQDAKTWTFQREKILRFQQFITSSCVRGRRRLVTDGKQQQQQAHLEDNMAPCKKLQVTEIKSWLMQNEQLLRHWNYRWGDRTQGRMYSCGRRQSASGRQCALRMRRHTWRLAISQPRGQTVSLSFGLNVCYIFPTDYNSHRQHLRTRRAHRAHQGTKARSSEHR